MRFAFIETEKANHKIATMCSVLRVSRTGYYAWLTRPQSQHTLDDNKLRVLVRASHERSKQRYGSPRVHRDIVEGGMAVSRKRIVRIMQEEGLVGRPRKRFKCTTQSDPSHPVAANLLKQNFSATAPNQRWVGDTTELRIGEQGAKLYLAAIVDLYSRYVVGWALSAVNDRHLTMTALEAAVRRRCPDAGLIHHSDRGSPYTSEDYRRMLVKNGIVCSMSRKGNCYDNAAMESWFSTLKAELGEHFESFTAAKAELFDYIESFYNSVRRHSSLGYKSPKNFEAAARRRTPNAA